MFGPQWHNLCKSLKIENYSYDAVVLVVGGGQFEVSGFIRL